MTNSTPEKNPDPSAQRHTNAAAGFTLLAALLFLVGAVTFGAALEKKAGVQTCILAASPLGAAAAASAVAYRARKKSGGPAAPAAASGSQASNESITEGRLPAA